MPTAEWNLKTALQVEREEGREEGWEEGWEGGRAEGAERKQDEVLALIEQGLSAAEIKEKLTQKT